MGGVPVLVQAEGLGEGLSVLLGVVGHAADGVGDRGRLHEVEVGIGETAHLGPFIHQQVLPHGIDCERILGEKQRAGPVAAERGFVPFRCRGAVAVAGAVGAVDQVEQRLAAQVLVADEIDLAAVFGMAPALVGIDPVVGVLVPVLVQFRGAVPVLGGERDAGSGVDLEQGAVDHVVGVHDAFREAVLLLAVARGERDGVLHEFTLLAAFPAHVVHEVDAREGGLAALVERVGDVAARLADGDVLLAYAGLLDQALEQGEGHVGRAVELLVVGVGEGVVHVELDGDLLALDVGVRAAAVALVELGEKGLPGLLDGPGSGQLQQPLGDHPAGLGLVVPALLPPHAGLSVPGGHAGGVDPGYAARVDALADADGMVGHVIVHARGAVGMARPQDIHAAGRIRLADDVEVGAGAEVRVLPGRHLPDNFLRRGDLEELHAAGPFFLRPAGHPVADQRVAVLQARGGLEVPDGEGEVGLGDFPDHLAVGIELAHEMLAVAAGQVVPVRELVHVPAELVRDALEDVPFGRDLQDLLLLHEAEHEVALRRAADMAELPVGAGVLRGDDDLADHFVQLGVPDHDLAGRAVEREEDEVRSQGLAGMRFGALRADVFPEVLALAVEQAELRHGGIEDVAVGQDAHVVEFEDAVPLVADGEGVFKVDLAVLDDAEGLPVGVAGVPFARIGEFGVAVQALVLRRGG